MTTSNFPTATTGWIAIATGVSAILAVIFLTLMYTVNQSFGKVNDVFNSVIGISSVVLAYMVYAEHHAKSPLMSHIARSRGGRRDLYHHRIDPDHFRLHRLCAGRMVFRYRVCSDRFVAGGILLCITTR